MNWVLLSLWLLTPASAAFASDAGIEVFLPQIPPTAKRPAGEHRRLYHVKELTGPKGIRYMLRLVQDGVDFGPFQIPEKDYRELRRVLRKDLALLQEQPGNPSANGADGAWCTAGWMELEDGTPASFRVAFCADRGAVDIAYALIESRIVPVLNSLIAKQVECDRGRMPAGTYHGPWCKLER